MNYEFVCKYDLLNRGDKNSNEKILFRSILLHISGFEFVIFQGINRDLME